VNTLRLRLGHESLDVTLAYFTGKDAESEEAQEQANSSSLALYAKSLVLGFCSLGQTICSRPCPRVGSSFQVMKLRPGHRE
jgi:hypothetical protein